MHLQQLRLSRDNSPVRAWLAACSVGELQELETCLERVFHPNELSYLETLRFPARRTSYLLGRACAKRAVGAYLGERVLCHIDVARGVFEQPLVRHASPDVPDISLSHSGQEAIAIAFDAGHPMGIDLQHMEPGRSDTVVRSMTDGERQGVEGLGLPLSESAWHLWAMREALSKALRCGLTVPLPLLQAHQLTRSGNGLASTFQNFEQYQAVSARQGTLVAALVLPRRMRLEESPFHFLSSL